MADRPAPGCRNEHRGRHKHLKSNLHDFPKTDEPAIGFYPTGNRVEGARSIPEQQEAVVGLAVRLSRYDPAKQEILAAMSASSGQCAVPGASKGEV